MRKTVKSSREMDDETFIKHINARHLPPGRKQGDGVFNYPKVIAAWRGWHRARHYYNRTAPPEFKIPHPHKHITRKES